MSSRCTGREPLILAIRTLYNKSVHRKFTYNYSILVHRAAHIFRRLGTHCGIRFGAVAAYASSCIIYYYNRRCTQDVTTTTRGKILSSSRTRVVGDEIKTKLFRRFDIKKKPRVYNADISINLTVPNNKYSVFNNLLYNILLLYTRIQRAAAIKSRTILTLNTEFMIIYGNGADPLPFTLYIYICIIYVHIRVHI